jgi:hypothetical protein
MLGAVPFRALRISAPIRTALETLESWRERDHDALVLALVLVAWVGERGLRQYWLR